MHKHSQASAAVLRFEQEGKHLKVEYADNGVDTQLKHKSGLQKVIISNDLGSLNHGVSSILKHLGVPEIIQVQYCDDAYLRIKKRGMETKPFDVHITDLSFKMDHREKRFASGEALIHEL